MTYLNFLIILSSLKYGRAKIGYHIPAPNRDYFLAFVMEFHIVSNMVY